MVLERHYNKKLNTCSPEVKDYERVTKMVNENEVITFIEVDNHKRVIANGCEADWKLNNMLKAGINPQTGIHTGNNTRLAGINELNIFKETTNKLFENKEETIEQTETTETEE